MNIFYLHEDAKTAAAAQQEKLDKQKREYKAMQFKNPFSNMENVFEDLTVNQQQAQFQAQQGAQQRANILGGLRSSCTYVGASSLKQLSKCTTFVRVNNQYNDVFGKF